MKINSESIIGEIVAENYKAASVFKSHNIDFCCNGNRSIATVSEEKNYISPQINRAVKNKSYFYNCYGKEEKFYIENQG